MSKRIKISINNNRPKLGLLFHQYLHRKAKEHTNNIVYSEDDYDDMAAYWDKMFPGWDDDGDVVYPMLGDTFGLNKNRKKKKDVSYDFYETTKRSKHKHRRGGKKSKDKHIDIDVPYSGYEEYPTEIDDEYDDEDYQSKTIWFYPDYHYKDDRLEFNSLKAFDKYCAKEGYSVPKYVESDIVYLSESHCCLNPIAEKEGILEIMAEESYGNMFYEACDASELSGD
jgi:hypothetical protein